MAAQSVTGVGQGMSNGKFKKENNNGCGCNGGKKCQPKPPELPVKRGCYVVSKSGGGSARYNAGSGHIVNKGC
jgi:hypothetical protein